MILLPLSRLEMPQASGKGYAPKCVTWSELRFQHLGGIVDPWSPLGLCGLPQVLNVRGGTRGTDRKLKLCSPHNRDSGLLKSGES